MIVYHETLSGKVTFALPTYLHNGKIKCACECPGNSPTARTGCVTASESKLLSVVHPKNIALRFDGEMIDALTARCFEKSELFRVHRIAWAEETDRHRLINYLKCYISQRSTGEAELDWQRIFRMINRHCPCIVSIEFVEETLINNATTNDNVLSLFFIYRGKAVGLMGWVTHIDGEFTTSPQTPVLSSAADQILPSVSECSSGIDISGPNEITDHDPPNRPISCVPSSNRSNALILDMLNRPHSTVPVLSGRHDTAAAMQKSKETEAKQGGNLFFFQKYETPLTDDLLQYIKSLSSDDETVSDSVYLPLNMPPKRLTDDDDESSPSTNLRSVQSIRLLEKPSSPPPLRPAGKRNEQSNAALNNQNGKTKRTKTNKRNRQNSERDKQEFLQLPVLSPEDAATTSPAPRDPPLLSKRKRSNEDQNGHELSPAQTENVPTVGLQRNTSNLSNPVRDYETAQSYLPREPNVNCSWRLPDKYLPEQTAVDSTGAARVQTAPMTGWQPVGSYFNTVTPTASQIAGVANSPIAYQPGAPAVTLAYPPNISLYPGNLETSDLVNRVIQVSSAHNISNNYHHGNMVSASTYPVHVNHPQSSPIPFQPQDASQAHSIPLPYALVDNRNFQSVTNLSFDPSGSFRIPPPPDYRRRFGPVT